MAAPDRNYEIQIIVFTGYSFMYLHNLKFVKRKKYNIFIQNIHIAVHFAAPLNLLSRAAASMAPA
jgi:hypothetical protein